MKFLRSTVILVLPALLCSGLLRAQPSLQFNRIQLSWPNVTLYFRVICGSAERFDLLPQNFHVSENGSAIDSFTLSCPDTSKNCCSSVALVIDRSGAMGQGKPSGLDAVKEGANAFIDAMDPDGRGCDEAAIVSFNQLVTVDVFMTGDRSLLKQGIDSLAASGGASAWDAAVEGVLQLAKNGMQTCRAVILVMEDGNIGSGNTPDDVIQRAVNSSIRVFTIGLGTGANDADLQRIASDTGGKYFKIPVPQSNIVISVFREIGGFIHNSYRECAIAYDAQCPDGTRRNVDLAVNNLTGCPGGDRKTLAYFTRRDTTTFMPLSLSLDTVTAVSGREVLIPLLVDPAGVRFGESTFKLLFDSTCCRFLGVTTDGCGLAGVPIDIRYIMGGVEIASLSSVPSISSDTLLRVRFFVPSGEDIHHCPLRLLTWSFKSGCYLPVLHDGMISVFPSTSIQSPAEVTHCPGDTALFFISRQQWPILSHIWELSTDNGGSWNPVPGGSDDTLIVAPVEYLMSGWLWRVRFRFAAKPDVVSNTVRLEVLHPVQVASQPSDLIACAGGGGQFIAAPDRLSGTTRKWQVSTDGGVTWSAPSGPVYTDTLSLPDVTQKMNGYTYRIIFQDVCSRADTSRAALLTVLPPPSILVHPISRSVKSGDTVTFIVRTTAGNNLRFQWLKDDAPLPDATDSILQIFPARKSDEGAYRVIVSGDCGKPDTSSVAILSVTINRAGGETALPADLLLYPVYPNPAAGEATIRFRLPAASRVSVTVYDMHGRKIGISTSAECSAGENSISIATGALPAGVYAVVLHAGRKMAVGRMTIVR